MFKADPKRHPSCPHLMLLPRAASLAGAEADKIGVEDVANGLDIESVLMAASNLASNDTYALRRYQDLLRVSLEMQARLVRFYDRATRVP